MPMMNNLLWPHGCCWEVGAQASAKQDVAQQWLCGPALGCQSPASGRLQGHGVMVDSNQQTRGQEGDFKVGCASLQARPLSQA